MHKPIRAVEFRDKDKIVRTEEKYLESATKSGDKESTDQEDGKDFKRSVRTLAQNLSTRPANIVQS